MLAEGFSGRGAGHLLVILESPIYPAMLDRRLQVILGQAALFGGLSVVYVVVKWVVG